MKKESYNYSTTILFLGNLISFDDLTTILSANELKQICKELKLKINSKQGAIAALKSYCREKSLVNYYTPSTNNNSNRVLKMYV